MSKDTEIRLENCLLMRVLGEFSRMKNIKAGLSLINTIGILKLKKLMNFLKKSGL